MDLDANQVGPRGRERVEDAVPLGLIEDRHVVRRCGGLRAGRRADFWNSESAWGRSTIPSTLRSTGAMPARPICTVSPGAACRLAAVCWARSTPPSAPTRVRIASGNCAR